jgi:hypothetical protein
VTDVVVRARPRCALHASAKAEATCLGCGQFLCGPCAREAETRCARCRGGAHPVPWEDPKLGAPGAFVRTLLALARAPTFFAQLPSTGGLRAPLTFAATAVTLAALVGAGFAFLSAQATAATLAGLQEQMQAYPPELRGAAMPMLEAFERLVPVIPRLELAYALMQPILAPLELLVMAALTHGVARLLGGRGSFEATVRAMAYAAGGQMLAVMPIFGNTIAPLARLLLVGVGLHRAHGVSAGRAFALAVWWIPVALLLGAVLVGLMLSALVPVLFGGR